MCCQYPLSGLVPWGFFTIDFNGSRVSQCQELLNNHSQGLGGRGAEVIIMIALISFYLNVLSF